MLFHPAAAPSISFDFLLDSCSSYCAKVCTWRMTFKDGSRIGIQSEVKNSLQNAFTLPKVNMVGQQGNGHDQGVGVCQDPPPNNTKFFTIIGISIQLLLWC